MLVYGKFGEIYKTEVVNGVFIIKTDGSIFLGSTLDSVMKQVKDWDNFCTKTRTLNYEEF